jgi:Tol biopolymer transport system component/tRNA A-37 threonylcarbamoyl transferase component Bud32
MGEVYRARDIRLERTVAVKVLTGTLAADAESRQRFEQEARAIAALNDPHICTIHDIGRHGDLDYIVLEYVEGETLAAHLKRTPVLTVDEAVAIAIQIGDALARAHRAGISHRDLKPGNVMLVRRAAASDPPDVKLLDFGLASRTTTARPAAVDVSLDGTATASLAATRPIAAAASSGLSGTLQYMSPEQLDGDEGDHRVDIFALGCVLYEMLAGRKAFEGGSAMTAIAAIMNTEPPPIPALEAAHPLVNHLMRRCLEKDRDRRWQSIGDVVGELRWAVAHPIDRAASPAARTGLNAIGKAAVVLTPVLATLLLITAVRLLRQPGPVELPALRLEISTAPTDDTTLALSADGRRIAFVANQNRRPVLWVRSLDGAESRVLPGTEGASFPFWAPDGRSVGFFADGKVKRIDVDGGRPIVLADAPNGRGGAWNSDGVILFAPSVSDPIMRVPAGGGKAEAVTEANATTTGPDHRWPQFLPGGKQFLYSSTLGTPQTNGVYVASLDKTPPKRILESGIGRFAAPDRLLTVAEGALRAFRFDPATGGVQGEAVVIAQGLAAGTASVAASDGGVLAYRSGAPQRRQLMWVDRTGNLLREIGEPERGYIGSPELSPDEQSVAVFSQRSGDNDIWVIELARGLARRITEGPPADAHPVWDPDGDHVAFVSSRLGRRGPLRQSLTTGKLEPLFPDIDRGAALSWSRDRRYVLLRREGVSGPSELVVMATSGPEPRVVPVPQSQNATEGQLSPDGKWVASVSNESGRPEVFVQSFPDGRMRTQVSTGGGTQVRWSADGKEIFYLAPDGKLMAVMLTAGGSSLNMQLPKALFETHLATGTNVIGNKPQYAVSRDGRFLLNAAIESASSPIVIAVNWMNKQ